MSKEMMEKIKKGLLEIRKHKEIRAVIEGLKLSGYASTIDQWYRLFEDDWVIFDEKMAVGAFDEILEDDVVGLINHDDNGLPLCRTAAKTMRIVVDDKGLRFEMDLPTWASNVAESVNRGDIDSTSIGFRCGEDLWEEQDLPDGRLLIKRTILKIERLRDISVVNFPANPNATVEARGMDHVHDQIREIRKQRNKRDMKLRYLKLKEGN